MQFLTTLQADLVQTQDEHVKQIQNTQAYKVHFYAKQYLLETNQKAVTINKYLIIERENGSMQERDGQAPQAAQQKCFSAFLGTIQILDKAFLLFVENVERVCAIEGHDIFMVDSVAFLPFDQEAQIYESRKANEILTMIDSLRKLLSLAFYFSYTYDLTLSKIKQSIQASIEQKYLWNINLIRNYLKSSIDRKWISFLVQGYVGYFELYVNGKKMDFYLLSRRSSRRAGTRYNSRGIDDDGNVSNYVESEQLVYYNNLCCSHLQIRGSVPIFWTQRGYLTETKIMRTAELTKSAFKRHFKDILEDYSRVINVNLMAKKKKGEQMLTEAYEEQIKVNELLNVKYEWFDFHHECKNNVFALSNPLIRKLTAQIKNFSFFVEDQKKKEVQSIQHGVFRVNCLDCLDRTNFIQAKIAMVAFDQQMKLMGVDFSQILKMAPIEALDQESSKIHNYFIQYFKNVWADNGDMLSAQYTGTGSTHTNITRTGRRDMVGMIDHGTKSLMRFYIQNFSDNVKQEAIDVLLGAHTDSVNTFTQDIEKQLLARVNDYCDFSERTILIVTWNLGGSPFLNKYDLNKSLIETATDIVVFGLQEMIPSSTAMIVGGSSEVLAQWDELILQNLNVREKYIPIKSKDLLSSGILIYARDRFKNRIGKVSYDTVKLGFLGQIANKGGVIVKMFIDDTLICFSNVHFEHGQKSLQSRIVNVQDLHSLAFNTIGIGKKKEEKIEQCDYRFLFGDLNFRVALEADKVIAALQKHKLFIDQNRVSEAKDIFAQLIKLDELNSIKQVNGILKQYQEPEITFMPTYKFEPFSHLYNRDRTPSWTDRIMVATNPDMTFKNLFYKSHDITYSDHRPVTAIYQIRTKKENEYKKECVLKEIYQKDLKI